MKITNIHGLPQTLVNLAENPSYTKGKAKISVTSLISPPRIVQLRKRHDDEIEVDVSELIWQILGTAVHKVLEQGGDETNLPEERLFARVNGWDVSGQVDVQVVSDDTVDIVDYKNTSVWSIIYGKAEWVAQLNTYGWLVARTKGWKVRKLRVVTFLRDWNRKDAAKDKSYPEQAIHEIEIPLWSLEEQTKYIIERVRAHQEGEMAAMFDEPLAECTDEERWTRKTDWAVMLPNGSRAYRTFPDTPDGERDARALLLKMKPKNGKPFTVTRRIGDRNRCLGNYCRVAPFCEQWQAELKQQRSMGLLDLDADHQGERA